MSNTFQFDGGAGSYVGIAILSTLLTICTFGLAFPWALTMRQRWITNHTIIEGRRLKFVGSGAGLIGTWIKMLFFIFITLGIYSFWVMPRIQRWIVENTEFEA